MRERAEAGDADAQLILGRFYADGIFVSQDDAKAAQWYLSAAKQGQADAQVWLGMAYESGKGISKDYVEAYARFDVAAASIKNSELRRDGVKALLNTATADGAASRSRVIQPRLQWVKADTLD